MSSVPYSRYLFYPIPWYSFLIVCGSAAAVFLSCIRERRARLPKDTVIDLSLWLFPCGILGARIYYVIFTWDQFRSDFLSVLRIWEGGIAIYGGIIAGFITMFVFARHRKLSLLLLCDLVSPGLALAQSIGRWGNWFNMEAYGFEVSRKALCFFPFAVQIPSDGYRWHLATFFYESLWDFLVFLFLILSDKKILRRRGDVFFFYLFLYASGRLVIEELRLDSLFASSVRISQLLSILLCIFILLHYARISHIRSRTVPFVRYCLFPFSLFFSVFVLLFTLSGSMFTAFSKTGIILMLSLFSLTMILCLFFVYIPTEIRENDYADN